MATKGVRVPVAFGEAGTGKRKRKKAIVLPLDSIAKKAGLDTATDKDLESEKKTKTGEPYYLKGHRDNSIKIWLGAKTAKGSKRTISIPYPAGATIRQIRAFVKKVKGARSFTMPSGNTYGIGGK